MYEEETEGTSNWLNRDLKKLTPTWTLLYSSKLICICILQWHELWKSEIFEQRTSSGRFGLFCWGDEWEIRTSYWNQVDCFWWFLRRFFGRMASFKVSAFDSWCCFFKRSSSCKNRFLWLVFTAFTYYTIYIGCVLFTVRYFWSDLLSCVVFQINK